MRLPNTFCFIATIFLFLWSTTKIRAQQFEKLLINGTENVLPNYFIKFNGLLYFTANGSSGNELWQTDGTQVGTNMVIDLNPNGDSSPRQFTVLNSHLVFLAKDSTNRYRLWSTDGTASGTVMLDTAGASIAGSMHKLNNKLLYFKPTKHPEVMWETDGTPNGTQALTIPALKTAKTFTTIYNENQALVYNNKLYFCGADTIEPLPNGARYRLWVSDGTTSGTFAINQSGKSPKSFTVINNKVIFTADRASDNNQFYQTDGTITGTSMIPGCVAVYDLTHGKQNARLFPFNGKVYYSGRNNANRGLYSVGLNSTAPQLVKNYQNSVNFIEYQNKLYFSSRIPATQTGLCVTDGTNIGTNMIAPLQSNSTVSIKDLKEYNNKIYFTAFDTLIQPVFYTSNGSTLTQIIPDTAANISYVGANPLVHNQMHEYNGSLYFGAMLGPDTPNNYQLWKLTDNSVTSTINRKTEKRRTSIFPNPTRTGIAYLKNEDEKEYQIVITNSIGMKVCDIKSNEVLIKLDLSKFASGMYFVIDAKQGLEQKILTTK